jgi:hypothetical protein
MKGMGYATKDLQYLRAFSIALLGLLCIGVGLASTADAATPCSSAIQKAGDGAYEGCHVKMGNRDFIVGPAQSSAEGCAQVCSILAELAGNGAPPNQSARATTYRE